MLYSSWYGLSQCSLDSRETASIHLGTITTQCTVSVCSFTLCCDNVLLYRSEAVYPGLQLFKEGKRLQSVLEVPGVAAGSPILLLKFNVTEFILYSWLDKLSIIQGIE